MDPRTRYARSGETSLAYQVIGDGAIDLLFLSGWLSHVEQLWELPPHRRFVERLAGFTRVIVYDRRGTGLSDNLDPASFHSLEQEAEDALAVLDAAGSTSAALYAKWFGGPLGVHLAVFHPERVRALILYAAVARAAWAEDYDWAMTREEREDFAKALVTEWGETGNSELERWTPSMAGDPGFAAWMSRLVRSIASPGRARIRATEAGELDVRELLPRVDVPTLVMHRPRELVWDVRHSRYMAEHIAGARYVELEGEDALDILGDSDAIVEEIDEFLTGERGGGELGRALLTVMFTDIVDSTGRASEIGDRAWRDLLAAHDETVRRELRRFRGIEVKTTGDGFLATFAGTPSSALHCGASIVAAARQLGMEVRVGIHTGECELIGADVGGVAVHIASRISALAGPGEVLASSAVAGAVAGGLFDFEDRGAHALKGVRGSWQLFAFRSS